LAAIQPKTTPACHCPTKRNQKASLNILEGCTFWAKTAYPCVVIDFSLR
jgi:hypothetical protein